MNMPTFPPTIPILGKPFEFLGHLPPTVIIQCQCEDKCVIVLHGVQSVATCPACKHRFLITDDVKIQVGALRPAAEPSVVTQ